MADETQTAEVRQIVAQLSKLHQSLAEKTVTLKGALGTFVGDDIYFKNDNGMFEVQFDAGRMARKKIDGCQLNWFDWSKSKCLFEVDAEISISDHSR